MNSTQESSWLGAVIDGECCINVRDEKRWKNARPSLRLTLKMCDKDVVEAFHRITKTTTKICSYEDKRGNYKTTYISVCNGIWAENSLKRAYPYLHKRKKKETDKAFRQNLSHYSKE
jgi:hypothetical protein